MVYDVFISYASEDRNIANAACHALEERRIKCWIAPRDVKPGTNYGEAIVDGIGHCSVMLLVFSSRSNRSQHVLREVERAVGKGLYIIPLRIEDVIPSEAMEYFISTTHWLDAMTPPMEDHLRELVDAVETMLLSCRRDAGYEKKKPPRDLPFQMRDIDLTCFEIGCEIILYAAYGGKIGIGRLRLGDKLKSIKVWDETISNFLSSGTREDRLDRLSDIISIINDSMVEEMGGTATRWYELGWRSVTLAVLGSDYISEPKGEKLKGIRHAGNELLVALEGLDLLDQGGIKDLERALKGPLTGFAEINRGIDGTTDLIKMIRCC